MKADVWGEALDEVLTASGTLVIPSPAGVPFTQPLAAELASAEQLVFACGRYEGIDARVAEHFAKTHRVLEVSLGDYVLNGGEVAAFAMIEAITRLIPGFMGNAESIVEESHSDGLLEYPSYTRPASWRGLQVPDVLLSGHHAKIGQWRAEQQLARTRERRPDLLAEPMPDVAE
jgi:tRNA (guanine37-N1)-methyltransferase